MLFYIILSRLRPYVAQISGETSRRPIILPVLYSILIEFGVTIEIDCLSETYCKVRIGKHLPEYFSIQNGLQQ
jgi:hypothetical protein